MENVVIFYDHLEYITAIWYNLWYSLWSFGIFFTFWYVGTKKNLATLTKSGGTTVMLRRRCFLDFGRRGRHQLRKKAYVVDLSAI
jgi:hypothetical protein